MIDVSGYSGKLEEEGILHGEVSLTLSSLIAGVHQSHGQHHHVILFLLVHDSDVGVHNLVTLLDLLARLRRVGAQEVGEALGIDVERGCATLFLGDLGSAAVKHGNNVHVLESAEHLKVLLKWEVFVLWVIQDHASLAMLAGMPRETDRPIHCATTTAARSLLWPTAREHRTAMEESACHQ